MTTTTIYQNGNIGNRIANGIIAGIAEYYDCSEELVEGAAQKRFDEIVNRDYSGMFMSWYPYTSSVLGDYDTDYSNVDFDAIFEEIGNCTDYEYKDLGVGRKE